MDFVHNPYRCGPPKVGKYALVQSVVYRRVHVILLVSILLMQACRKSSLLAPLMTTLCGCVTPRQKQNPCMYLNDTWQLTVIYISFFDIVL